MSQDSLVDRHRDLVDQSRVVSENHNHRQRIITRHSNELRQHDAHTNEQIKLRTKMKKELVTDSKKNAVEAIKFLLSILFHRV